LFFSLVNILLFLHNWGNILGEGQVKNPGTKDKKTIIIVATVVIAVGLLGAYLWHVKKNSHKEIALPTVEVSVTAVVKKDVPLVKEWVGTTDGDVNAHIHPKVSGYILKQNYDEGTFVKEGQILFEIDPSKYQAAYDEAQGNLTKAEASQKQSAEDARRYTSLVSEGAVSKKEYTDAVQTNNMNKGSVSSAKAALQQAKLNLDWTKVTSPISGLAGSAVAQIGDLVDTSKLLTTVSVIDPLKVSFPISENEYLWYQKRNLGDNNSSGSKSMSPDVSIVLNDGSVYPEKASLAFADREVDPNTGTIKVYVSVPNPKAFLRPGQYAKVRAQVGMFNDALVIPRKAIIETQGTTQVAVVGSDNKVEIRNITVGYTSDKLRVVTDGLKEGELVVTEGFLKIKDGMIVNPKKSEPDKNTNS